VQAKHVPGGVLGEGEIRVEFGEEFEVRECIVARGARGFEAPAGEVCKGVVNAMDGEGCQGGRLVDDKAESEGPGELLSN